MICTNFGQSMELISFYTTSILGKLQRNFKRLCTLFINFGKTTDVTTDL